jgi:hypothetical protein
MYLLVIWTFERFSGKIHANQGRKNKSHLDYASSYLVPIQRPRVWHHEKVDLHVVLCQRLLLQAIISMILFMIKWLFKQSIIFVIKKNTMISYTTIHNVTLITQLKQNRKGGQWRRMGGDVRWQCHFFSENIK